MKKALVRVALKLWHCEGGKNKRGAHSRLSGDCSGLTGDCSGLSGDCSRLSGDCTRLFGDCSGLTGNIDNCEITEEERKAGISLGMLCK